MRIAGHECHDAPHRGPDVLLGNRGDATTPDPIAIPASRSADGLGLADVGTDVQSAPQSCARSTVSATSGSTDSARRRHPVCGPRSFPLAYCSPHQVGVGDIDVGRGPLQAPATDNFENLTAAAALSVRLSNGTLGVSAPTTMCAGSASTSGRTFLSTTEGRLCGPRPAVCRRRSGRGVVHVLRPKRVRA